MLWFWTSSVGNAYAGFNLSEYFSCEVKAQSAMCDGLLATTARIRVKIGSLPKAGSLELVALNQYEGLLEESGLQKLVKSTTAIDQSSVIIQSFTYDNLHNVMRPVFVQFIDVLKKGELAVVEITCASRDCSEYEPALNHIQQNLKMLPRSLEKLLK